MVLTFVYTLTVQFENSQHIYIYNLCLHTFFHYFSAYQPVPIVQPYEASYESYIKHQVQIAFQYSNWSPPPTQTYPSWTHLYSNLYLCPTSTLIYNLNNRTEEIRSWLRSDKHPCGYKWDLVCSKECKDIVDEIYQTWENEPKFPVEVYERDLFHIYDRHYIKRGEDPTTQDFLANSADSHTSYFTNIPKHQLKDTLETNYNNVFSCNYSALLFYHTMAVPTPYNQTYSEFYKSELYTYTGLDHTPGGIGGRSEFYSIILKL